MTKDVANAIAILQAKSLGRTGSESFWADRYEFALDDLIRNPERTGPPAHLVRNALSNARKRQIRRREVAPQDPLPEPSVGGEPSAELADNQRDQAARMMVDLADCLHRSSLRKGDRDVVALLFEGCGADEVAQLRGIPTRYARVQVSRARRRFWAAWAA